MNNRLRGFRFPYCGTCEEIHNVRTSRYPAGKPGDIPPCLEVYSLTLTPYRGDDRFKLSFHHVNLIMQNYRHPGRGLSLDILNFSQHSRAFGGRHSYYTNNETLTSVDARIIINKLYIRIQGWHVYRTLYSLRQSTKVTPTADLCKHWTAPLTSEFQENLAMAIASQEHLPGQQGESLSVIGKTISLWCRICCGVYELSVRSLNDSRVVLVVTKWLDLGSCRDMNDWEWRRHIVERDSSNAQTLKEWSASREVYESQGSGLSLGELTKRNEADLIRKRYRSRRRVNNNVSTTKL